MKSFIRLAAISGLVEATFHVLDEAVLPTCSNRVLESLANQKGLEGSHGHHHGRYQSVPGNSGENSQQHFAKPYLKPICFWSCVFIQQFVSQEGAESRHSGLSSYGKDSVNMLINHNVVHIQYTVKNWRNQLHLFCLSFKPNRKCL